MIKNVKKKYDHLYYVYQCETGFQYLGHFPENPEGAIEKANKDALNHNYDTWDFICQGKDLKVIANQIKKTLKFHDALKEADQAIAKRNKVEQNLR